MKNTASPIKRNESLKPVSRDHHHALLLSWKIRAGLKKEIEVERIKNYADWFYMHHLIPHFEIEEKYIFSLLDKENELVKRAFSEHSAIKSLFETQSVDTEILNVLQQELENHIRFEERILFNEIQKVATEEQLKLIEFHHDDAGFVDNLTDTFWE